MDQLRHLLGRNRWCWSFRGAAVVIREPIVSDVDGESPQRSFSRKMNAERKLGGGFKSKIFTEGEKAKLLEQGNGGTNTSPDEP